MRHNLSWVSVSIGMVIGFIFGRITSGAGSTASCVSATLRAIPTTTTAERTSDNYQSFVSNIQDIPVIPTSHPGIQKQVILPSFAIAPNLAALSIANIEPGQSIASHHHPTMFELFYVLSGQGKVTLTPPSNNSNASASSNTKVLSQGVFLQTAPGDFHSFRVEDHRSEPLRMIYFGVTTD